MPSIAMSGMRGAVSIGTGLLQGVSYDASRAQRSPSRYAAASATHRVRGCHRKFVARILKDPGHYSHHQVFFV